MRSHGTCRFASLPPKWGRDVVSEKTSSLRFVVRGWGVGVVTAAIVRWRAVVLLRRCCVIGLSRLFGSIRLRIGIVGLRVRIRIIRIASASDTVSPQKQSSKRNAGNSIKTQDHDATLLVLQAWMPNCGIIQGCGIVKLRQERRPVINCGYRPSIRRDGRYRSAACCGLCVPEIQNLGADSHGGRAR